MQCSAMLCIAVLQEQHDIDAQSTEPSTQARACSSAEDERGGQEEDSPIHPSPSPYFFFLLLLRLVSFLSRRHSRLAPLRPLLVVLSCHSSAALINSQTQAGQAGHILLAACCLLHTPVPALLRQACMLCSQSSQPASPPPAALIPTTYIRTGTAGWRVAAGCGRR
jgi:hypothetical protein